MSTTERRADDDSGREFLARLEREDAEELQEMHRVHRNGNMNAGRMDYTNDDGEGDDDGNDVGGTDLKLGPALTNDELLYDPAMDDADAEWVKETREAHRDHPELMAATTFKPTASGRGDEATLPRKGRAVHFQKRQNAVAPKKPAPLSDAVLNCPACFSTVCIDCQRHESFRNQFRAMFVMNCKIARNQKLVFQQQAAKKPSQRKRDTHKEGDAEGDASAQDPPLDSDKFSPVHCTVCDTVVAMYDQDEIYHFFNVIESLG